VVHESDGPLRFVGIDIGTTTTRLLVAEAIFVRNCVTGRTELGSITPLYEPTPIFTPISGNLLDLERIASQMDRWMEAASLHGAQVVAGGALITGLAARCSNTAAITALVKSRFPRILVVAADDPSLESWLAFMGNTLVLSRATSSAWFVNLDIGGGTTNIAWGRAGEVSRCGCYYIGARHVQFEPGTYRLRQLSEFGEALWGQLGISATVGSDLRAEDRQRLVKFQVELLERIVFGPDFAATETWIQKFCQTSVAPAPADVAPLAVVTLSGGVGELAYRMVHRQEIPSTTLYGDLGIDLALGLANSPRWGKFLRSHVPAGLGRATVSGLTLHATEVAGATLYLPDPLLLPVSDVPILGRLDERTTDYELRELFRRSSRTTTGAAFRVEFPELTQDRVRTLGLRLAGALEESPAAVPLVLLVTANVGKTLGQYATRWGKIPKPLIVIDEIPDRPAQFLSLGAPCRGYVTVSFQGMGSEWHAVRTASG
jgi:ethanolamine utilization protein EutA